MTEHETTVSAAAFTGQWIGETQGCTMPAHIWEISQRGDYLWLLTRWEDETAYAHFSAQMVANEAAFMIQYVENGKAILLDKQHFVVPRWCMCTREEWNDESPKFDVIFSRPGIAELTARSVYQKYLEKQASVEDEIQSASRTTSPNGNDSSPNPPGVTTQSAGNEGEDSGNSP